MDFLDFTSGTDLTKHQAKLKPWMEEKRFVLVTCPDGQTSPLLTQAVENCMSALRFALDIETTGLDSRVFNGETRDKIVGVCLSADGETGYYVPLRHLDANGNPSPHNVPMHVFRAEFERLMASPAVAVFHNGKFDQEFLQFNGGKPWREWDKADEWEDTLILAYLRDSRALQKGLKYLSKTELGMEMIELHELFGHEKPNKNIDYNFSKLDPTDHAVLAYGCSDAICTYLLWGKLHPQVVYKGEGSQAAIYKIEKMCVAGTRWCERDRVYIDKAKVAELIDLGQKELFDSLVAVYDAVSAAVGRDITPFYFLYAKEMIRASNPNLSISSGTDSLQGLLRTCKDLADSLTPEANFPSLAKYRGRTGVSKRGKDWPAEYDVMSAQQLGVLLDEMEVPGLERTEKSGQVKTDADSLDALLDEQGEKVPWLKKIQRFRETQKALSTYLMPLWEDTDPTDSTVKVNFNGHKTDTGRFSAPASQDPKKDGGTRFPMHGTPATYDPSRPECLARIRECIAARPGRYIVAIDFSGEELRIITNLSGEPKWLTEFFRCSSCSMTFDRGDGVETPPAPPPFCPKCGSDKIGDIHTLTALSLYGDEAPKRDDWKQLRGNAKAVNFALCYGGSGKAVVRSTGVDENEGARIKQAFDGSYTTLSGWWKRTQDYGRQHGFVTTAFGRKYPVPDIQLPRWGTNPKGERINNGSFIAKAERNAVNGPIQGTGADVIKYAMYLCYKACKERGWFGRVSMIATVHDELVFDIEKELLEEAIEVLSNLMCNNSAVKSLKWRVPLTCDIECGPNWMVEWHITKMNHGKKKWPDELKPYFPKAIAKQTAATDPTATGAEPTSGTPSPARATAEAPAESEAKPSNGVYTHTMQGALTTVRAYRLSEVIVKCAGRGTSKLRVLTSDGAEIDYGPAVQVNHVEFRVWAREAGL